MKNTIRYSLLILILGVFTVSCTKEDTPEANCTISPQARDHFLYDASALAMEYLYANQHADTSQVFIPQNHVDPYLQALGLIYDSSLPERDSVINLNLHYQHNETYSALMYVFFSEPWLANWLNNTIPTGNATVDQLISTYDLNIADHHTGNVHDLLVVESNQGPVNAIALAALFESQSGVSLAGPNTYWNPFSKLSCTFTGNIAHVTFFQGWGDCFAGCFGYHRWEFDVDLDNCTVCFTGYYP